MIALRPGERSKLASEAKEEGEKPGSPVGALRSCLHRFRGGHYTPVGDKEQGCKQDIFDMAYIICVQFRKRASDIYGRPFV